MKYLLILVSSLILAACSPNYAEDEDYVYVKKNKTACKAVSRKEVHPSKGLPFVEIKYKCVYTKELQEPLPSQPDPELLQLLQEISPDA